MKTITRNLAGVAALGLAATAIVTATPSSNATGDAAQPTTLVLRFAGRDAEHKHLDIGRKGDSVGDRYLSAVTLKSDGEVAGRFQYGCTVLDETFRGHLCTVAVLLEDGSITFAAGGVSEPVGSIEPEGDVFAVTGGTGAYQGAEGQLEVADNGSAVTITLLP
jgi:hypothetical protein